MCLQAVWDLPLLRRERPKLKSLIIIVCVLFTIVACNKENTSMEGRYQANLIFPTKDSIAKEAVKYVTLNLHKNLTFVLETGREPASGNYEISGRFLVTHIKQIGGQPAEKVVASDQMPLDAVYEILLGGTKLRPANAQASSNAFEFIRE